LFRVTFSLLPQQLLRAVALARYKPPSAQSDSVLSLRTLHKLSEGG